MGPDQHVTHAIRTSQASSRVDRGSPDLADGQPTYVALGAYRLATEFIGDSNAPTVVLLHGIPGWRGTWRSVAARLAHRAYVVVPDLAGFGESSPAPAGMHAAEHADLVVALIRSLGLSRVHLVGFDFGGPVAVMVCACAPDLIASLDAGRDQCADRYHDPVATASRTAARCSAVYLPACTSVA